MYAIFASITCTGMGVFLAVLLLFVKLIENTFDFFIPEVPKRLSNLNTADSNRMHDTCHI